MRSTFSRISSFLSLSLLLCLFVLPSANAFANDYIAMNLVSSDAESFGFVSASAGIDPNWDYADNDDFDAGGDTPEYADTDLFFGNGAFASRDGCAAGSWGRQVSFISQHVGST